MFLPKSIHLILLTLALSSSLLLSKDATPDSNKAPNAGNESLISEKDSVDLVENGSAEDALKRRPDLRFNNIKIDGENAQLSLSDIPVEALTSIEVLKAVTPDLDADSRGGSLTLRSRPSYLQSTRTLKGEVSARYLSGAGNWGPDFQMTYGNAPGVDPRFGYIITAGWDTRKWVDQNHILNWEDRDISGETLRVLRVQRLNQFHLDGQTPSISGTFDFKVTESLSLFLKAGYEKGEADFQFPITQLLYEDGTYTTADETGAAVENINIRRGIRDWAETETDAHMAIGGVYKNDLYEWDFRFYDSENEEIQPDFFVADFLQSDADVAYNLIDRQFPQYEQQDGTDIKNTSEYLFELISHRYRSTLNTESIGTINLKRKMQWGNWNGFLKTGLKTRWRSKDKFSDNRIYDIYNGDFNLSEVVSSESISHSDNRYILDTFPDATESQDFFDENMNDFVYNEGRSRESSDPQTYEAEETIQSGYAMASMEKNALRLLLGFRMEDTTIEYIGNEVIISDMGEYIETNKLSGSSSYTNWFPSIHGRYHLNENITLIASRTETIKRPRYSQLVPFRNIDIEDRTITEGNPDLRPTLFTNYDFSIDYAGDLGTFLSLELFYKQIEDPISSVLSIIEGGIYDGFERTRNENIEPGTIHGAQFTLNQSLGDIWSPLDGISFNTDLRLQETEPETTYISDTELGVTLSYQNSKWYGQLEYNYLSDYPVKLSDDPFDSLGSFSRTRLSATVSHRFSKLLRIELELNNLTSELTRETYEGDEMYPAHSRFSPWSSEISMKFTL